MKRSSLMLVLLFAMIALNISFVQAQKEAPQTLPFVSEELWTATATRGTTTRVIVTLNQSPLSVKNNPFHAQDVAFLQSGVLSSLPTGSYSNARQLSHLPIIFMDVDQTGLSALASNPAVKTVNGDYMFYKMDNQADTITGIDTVHTAGFTGQGITVAVLDSGIDTNHPGFPAGTIAHQGCYLNGTPSAPCPAGPNFAEDDDGHGTHVSGIITGADGVAPNSRIAAYKVLDSNGGGQFSNSIDAINHIIANHAALGIKVVNMSLGGGAFSTEAACNSSFGSFVTAFSSLNQLGIAVFVATGNDGSITSISAPGCASGAIGVGSTDDAPLTYNFPNSNGGLGCFLQNQTNAVSCYSNATATQGPGELVDILAPGCAITAEVMGGGTDINCGTSMATPMAAGIAAALLQKAPNTTPAQLENILETTGTLTTDYRSSVQYPRINAAAALAALDNPPPAGLANDNFANAAAISLPYTGTTDNFHLGTIEGSEPAHQCRNNLSGMGFQPSTGSASAWYTFSVSVPTGVTISTEGSTITTAGGANSDTMISLYSGSSLATLTLLGCGDDYHTDSGVYFSYLEGTLGAGTYYLQVSGWTEAALVASSSIHLTIGTEMPFFNLVANGTFETNVATPLSQPDGWNAVPTLGDRLKCDVLESGQFSYNGNCAYRFRGNLGENSKLVQPVNVNGIEFFANDTLSTIVRYRAGSTPKLKIKLLVTYSDLGTDKHIATLNQASATYGEAIVDPYIIASPNVQKIKLQFQNKATSGKTYIDDVNLRFTWGSTR